jgi:hypothetical protein
MTSASTPHSRKASSLPPISGDCRLGEAIVGLLAGDSD